MHEASFLKKIVYTAAVKKDIFLQDNGPPKKFLQAKIPLSFPNRKAIKAGINVKLNEILRGLKMG